MKVTRDILLHKHKEGSSTMMLQLNGPQFACAKECVFGCLEVAVGHSGCEVNVFSTVSLRRRREPQAPVFGLQGAQSSWPAFPGHTRQGSVPR